MMPKRRTMTPARKLRIHTLAEGRCGCDRPECGGAPVPISGPGVRYDHRIPFWIRPDLDDWPNLRPILKACDDIKTPRDLSTIAKTKRQATMRLDQPRQIPTMRRNGRSLPAKGQGPKIASRPFPEGSRPLRSRNDLKRR